ncbi:hypothetical protein SDC9_88573 [bioreactor metagenome]|uniref:Uncharacterized protein n=1 Tax=bioreactor metagenome TaxID=1076179 RepID=A0A644ZTE2_9ZZZZ
MFQCRTFALGAGNQQYRAHRSGHTGTDSCNIRADELHGVVNTQTGIHRSSGGIQVDRDILSWIRRVEEKQLSLNHIGGVIVHLSAKENDAIHHQTGENIHLCYIQLSFFKD